MYKRALACLFLLSTLCMPALAAAMHVVFINPGRAEEPYWRSVTRFMQPAASQLDIRLEVLYAERDYLKMIELAKSVTQRAEKPDYLIIVNEKLAGGEMLKLAERAGIKTFMAFSTFEPEQRGEFGNARQRYKNWIGSLVPNSTQAGRVSADELVAQAVKAHAVADDGKVHIALIAGDKATPTGVQRLDGALGALAANPAVIVEQVVYGLWERERAREQMAALLLRHPRLNAVWCASDLMAYGAIDAAEATGKRAGRDILFSAFNNSPEVLQARMSGRISALAGGHFTAGAWVLVMLYDYHHKIDFGAEAAEQRLPLFSAIDADMAQRFLARFGDENFSSVDFRAFSHYLNPGRARPEFGLPAVLK